MRYVSRLRSTVKRVFLKKTYVYNLVICLIKLNDSPDNEAIRPTKNIVLVQIKFLKL